MRMRIIITDQYRFTRPRNKTGEPAEEQALDINDVAAVATLAAQTVRPTTNRPYRTRIEARLNMDSGSDFRLSYSRVAGSLTRPLRKGGARGSKPAGGGQWAVTWPPAVITSRTPVLFPIAWSEDPSRYSLRHYRYYSFHCRAASQVLSWNKRDSRHSTGGG